MFLMCAYGEACDGWTPGYQRNCFWVVFFICMQNRISASFSGHSIVQKNKNFSLNQRIIKLIKVQQTSLPQNFSETLCILIHHFRDSTDHSSGTLSSGVFNKIVVQQNSLESATLDYMAKSCKPVFMIQETVLPLQTVERRR